MNELEYKNFYDKVGRLNGWDFSKIKCETVGATWDFYGEVHERCKSSDILLDVGTGGGENVLKIASSAASLIGIDNSNGMIKTAHSNLNKVGVQNFEFFQMDSEALTFPHAHFDIVSSWHARGTTARNIVRGMHKDETIDIYEKLPSNIVLLRATVPHIWDEYRDKTVEIFKLKTGAKVKLIPDTTHLLHWDKPEVVIEEIKSNWS